MNKIAINIADLDSLVPRNLEGFNPVASLLRDFCDEASPTINVSKERWDEVGIVLDGPATGDPEQVDALVSLLQTVIGPRKINRPVRVYREGPRGGWSKVQPERKKS